MAKQITFKKYELVNIMPYLCHTENSKIEMDKIKQAYNSNEFNTICNEYESDGLHENEYICVPSLQYWLRNLFEKYRDEKILQIFEQ